MIHSQYKRHTMHAIYIIHVLSIQIHIKTKCTEKTQKYWCWKKCSETTHQTELMNLMISCSRLSDIVNCEECDVFLLINDSESLMFAHKFVLFCRTVCSHWLYWYYIWGHSIHMQMWISFFFLKKQPAKYLSLAAENFRLSLLFTFFQSIYNKVLIIPESRAFNQIRIHFTFHRQTMNIFHWSKLCVFFTFEILLLICLLWVASKIV